MLLSFYKYTNDGFEENYLRARRKIDILCGLVVSERLKKETALKLYFEIEQDYATSKQRDRDLFRMIYKSRVKRLCEQFCSE